MFCEISDEEKEEAIQFNVRNTLRKGEFDWGALALDALWSTLIEESARRVELSKVNCG